MKKNKKKRNINDQISEVLSVVEWKTRAERVGRKRPLTFLKPLAIDLDKRQYRTQSMLAFV